jgi:hypothetical protein
LQPSRQPILTVRAPAINWLEKRTVIAAIARLIDLLANCRALPRRSHSIACEIPTTFAGTSRSPRL